MAAKYMVNSNYFCNINIVRKAYVCGILFARSALVYQRYKNKKLDSGFTITCNPKKLVLLRNVRKELRSNHKIRKILVNGQKRLQLQIFSVKLMRSLRKLGWKPGGNGVPKKLKKEYLGHFWRGYLDRRGWFWVASRHLYITGNYSQIKQLCNFYQGCLGIKPPTHRRQNGLWAIQCTRLAQVKAISSLMYHKNSLCFLPPKKIAALKLRKGSLDTKF